MCIKHRIPRCYWVRSPMATDETPKRKRQHTLPDRRLARAFGFTANDLATNRAGFMTAAQSWGVPFWLRRMIAPFSLAWPSFGGRRPQVQRLCGRASLRYEQHHIQSIFHADMIERYYLDMSDVHRTFMLSAEQYRALSENVSYILYVMSEANTILSLERTLEGCDP